MYHKISNGAILISRKKFYFFKAHASNFLIFILLLVKTNPVYFEEKSSNQKKNPKTWRKADDLTFFPILCMVLQGEYLYSPSKKPSY